jgi:hypothetical protein
LFHEQTAHSLPQAIRLFRFSNADGSMVEFNNPLAPSNIQRVCHRLLEQLSQSNPLLNVLWAYAEISVDATRRFGVLALLFQLVGPLQHHPRDAADLMAVNRECADPEQ